MTYQEGRTATDHMGKVEKGLACVLAYREKKMSMSMFLAADGGGGSCSGEKGEKEFCFVQENEHPALESVYDGGGACDSLKDNEQTRPLAP